MFLKFILFILFSLISLTAVKGQTFEWSQAKTYPGYNTSGNTICHDEGKNVYVAGQYFNNNDSFWFLTKYSFLGTEMWSKNTGKDLIVTIFQNNTILCTAYDTLGYYACRYDTAGTIIGKTTLIPWGSNHCHINDLTSDNSGNYYIAGWFRDTLTIGSQSVIGGSTNNNLYFAKFNFQDSCLWLKSSSGTNSSIYDCCLRVDLAGNVYIAGPYLGTLTIQSVSVMASGMNGFICKTNSSGTVQWIYNVGTSTVSSQGITAIEVDTLGNVYVTGTYNKPLVLGTTTLTTNNQYDTDIFLFKLDNTGNTIWATKMGGPYTDLSRGLCLNNNGCVCLSGQYINMMSLGTLTLSSVAQPIANESPSEPFICKYDNNGTLVWAIQGDCNSAGGAGACTHICNADADLFVTGSFDGTVDFQGHPQSAAYPSVFIARITDASVAVIKQNVKNDLLFDIYPVPASENITVKASNGIVGLITLYDSFGNKIYSKFNDSSSITLELGKYPRGIYMVSFQNKNQNIIKKVIRE